MANKFRTDRFYAFKYNPKLKSILPAWDRSPLVFPLHPGSSRSLMINIHWIDQRFRKKFVEWLIARSLQMKDKKKFSRLVYDTVKGNRFLRPAMKGIRLYINRRATQVTEIPRDQVQNFFLPRQVQKLFFKRHRANKVYKDR